MSVPCYNCQGSLGERITSFFVGGAPRLRTEEVIYTPGERFRLQTVAGGIVHVSIGACYCSRVVASSSKGAAVVQPTGFEMYRITLSIAAVAVNPALLLHEMNGMFIDHTMCKPGQLLHEMDMQADLQAPMSCG